jgi:hypothetical protein
MGFDSVNHIIRHEFNGQFCHDGTPFNITVKTFHDVTHDTREALFAVDGMEIYDEELINAITHELNRMGHDI